MHAMHARLTPATATARSNRAVGTAACPVASGGVGRHATLRGATASLRGKRAATFDCHRVRFQNSDSQAVGAPQQEKTMTRSMTEPTVEEIMTPNPTVLQEDMPIQRAVRIFLDEDISGAPVVNRVGTLVGILSESDLMWKGAGSPQDHFIIPPTYIGFADLLLAWRDNKQIEEDLQKVLAKTVGQAMTPDPISVPPTMTMAEAAQLMLSRKVNRLPVVENGEVVGVLTRHDIVRGLVATNSPLL